MPLSELSAIDLGKEDALLGKTIATDRQILAEQKTKSPEMTKFWSVGPTKTIGGDERDFLAWVEKKHGIPLEVFEQMGHREPEALKCTNNVIAQIRDRFAIAPSHRLGMINGGGIPGAAALAANLFTRDDKVVVETLGHFNTKWASNVKKVFAALGKPENVTELPANEKAVQQVAFDPNDKGPKILFVTLNETTMGTKLSDASLKHIETLKKANPELLVCADMTSALGTLPSNPKDIDLWKIVDIGFFPPTKAIAGSPGGMTYIATNDRAIDRINNARVEWAVLEGGNLSNGMPGEQRQFNQDPFDNPEVAGKGIVVINTVPIRDLLKTEYLTDVMKEKGLTNDRMIERSEENLKTLAVTLAQHEEVAKKENLPYVQFRVKDPEDRSRSVTVLEIVDPSLSKDEIGKLVAMTQKKLGRDGKNIARGLGMFPGSEPGFRFLAHYTHTPQDIALLVGEISLGIKEAKQELVREALMQKQAASVGAASSAPANSNKDASVLARIGGRAYSPRINQAATAALGR